MTCFLHTALSRLATTGIVLAVGFLASCHVAAKPPPLEAYAALPAAHAARLSPDGKHLALIMPVQGKNTLVIWNLDENAKPRSIPTGDYEPSWISWKKDDRLLLGLRFVSMRLPQRPTLDTRLVAVNIDGSKAISLVQAENYLTYVPQLQDKVVSLLPDDENHILLELPALERIGMRPSAATHVMQFGSLNSGIQHPEVARVDINTGSVTTIARPHGWVTSWQADAAGNVRLGREIHEKRQSHQVKRLADGTWHTIQSFELNKGRVFSPLAFTEHDPDHLYVLSNHEGGPSALYEFDVLSDSFVRTVASNPRSSVTGIVKDRRLVGYIPGQGEKPIYIDSVYAREAAGINQALPDSNNYIIDRSADGKRTLVLVTRKNEPAAYWLLDRSEGSPALSPLIENYPDIKPEHIHPLKIVTYQARDGLDIPAFLTLPNRFQGGLDLPIPFVILPHDGPTSRDTITFNYLAQFFASLGYGVLQPQYRGSSGYGASFEIAGYQQWGLKMQDDLTDGTQWLIQQKLADPERIAIVGQGYGGYAALMGAIREPSLYRGAAAIAPISDLVLLLDDRWHFLFADINLPRMGTDRNSLERNSPARNAERIKTPVLLIHGRKDHTIPVEQTEYMVDALKKHDRKFDVLYLEKADGALNRQEDRLATLKALERFLGNSFSPDH